MTSPTYTAIQAGGGPSEQATPLHAALNQIDLEASGAGVATLNAVTELAIEIAREGREGRKIGTLFTVGAQTQVL